MNHWQDFVVAVLIGMASIYLARLLWYRLSKRGKIGCLSCRNCSSYPKSGNQQDRSVLVNIQPSPPKADQD